MPVASLHKVHSFLLTSIRVQPGLQTIPMTLTVTRIQSYGEEPVRILDGPVRPSMRYSLVGE